MARSTNKSRTFTVGQVAKRVMVSKVTVYTYFREGLLPSIVVGGRRRVLESDLEKFLADRKQAAYSPVTRPPGRQSTKT